MPTALTTGIFVKCSEALSGQGTWSSKACNLSECIPTQHFPLLFPRLLIFKARTLTLKEQFAILSASRKSLLVS